jgi:GMP synthase-like glutamine amidotransferase
MKFAILDCEPGSTFEEQVERIWGRVLKENEEEEFHYFEVTKGQLPKVTDDYKGIVITGSSTNIAGTQR